VPRLRSFRGGSAPAAPCRRNWRAEVAGGVSGKFTPQAPSRLAAALRFWEPRRLVYNLVLAGFVLAWLLGTWPHFRPVMTPIGALQLAVLALAANVCYCAAYLAEMILQPVVAFGTNSVRWRSVLWVLGTVLAILLENYWIADEIYPFVR
jgi:hypothetical protein